MNHPHEPKVWGVFVGERGSELAAFNSNNGPFPPKPGAEGFVAIGWAAVGDMRMYKSRYQEFLKNFSILYPNENKRVLSTQANMVWNFAYEIAEGDYVVSPSSELGVLLVGRFIGDYKSDFYNWETVAPSKKRLDLMHIRTVRWIAALKEDDPRFKEIHRIGLLTVSSLSITPEKLINLIEKHD